VVSWAEQDVKLDPLRRTRDEADGAGVDERPKAVRPEEEDVERVMYPSRPRPAPPLIPRLVGRQPQKLVQVITFGCPVIIKGVCFRK
jgi:hypothetical protein